MKLTSYNMFLADLNSKGLDFACERAERLGFESVELLDFYPTKAKTVYEKHSIDEYKRAFEKHGLTLSCFSSAALLYVDDEDSVIAELCRQADFAAALGSKYFHHTFTIGLPHTPATLPYSTVLEKVAPVAKSVADHCAALGVTCLYEPQGMYFNGVGGLEGLYSEMKRLCNNIGICGDVGNPLFADEAPEDVFKAFAKEVKHVHVKDYTRFDEPLPEVKLIQKSRGGKYLYDCNIGEGIIDLAACFESLKGAGYTGDISFEIFADDETAKKSIEYIKNLI